MPQEGRTLTERTAGTVWAREGNAMLNAGLELQRLALTLPVESVTRQELLAGAKQWFTKAGLRGAVG